jgi:DNA gyrase/topoisomerase IV subunit B
VIENDQYSAENIPILKGLDGIRKRPLMYLQDVKGQGVANKLLQESLCIAFDSILRGDGNLIEIEFQVDESVVVQDNSSGLGVTPDQYGTICAKSMFNDLYACRSLKAEGHEHLCGVGIVCINAFSERLEVDTFKDGQHWHQRYKKGHVKRDLELIGSTQKTGNRLHFKLDGSIIQYPNFDADRFQAWLEAQPLSNEHVTVHVARDGANRIRLTAQS